VLHGRQEGGALGAPSTPVTVDSLEDIQLGEIIGKPIEAVVSAVPGGAIVASSVMQGAGSALFTLFIGNLTNYYLQTGLDRLDRGERRKLRLTSVQQLPEIVDAGFKQFKGVMGQISSKLAELLRRAISPDAPA
jgi:hypothetical protein